MCLAIPGKILEVDGPEGLVDFGGTKRKVRLDLVDAEIGDYVIVHVGYAIEVMDERQAQETLKYWSKHLL